MIYEGKGKKVYESIENSEEEVILFFKDNLTAYEGQKKGSFKGKGACCHFLFSLVFRYLTKEKVTNHWIKDVSPGESLCHKLTMIPLEVVVRNRLAGSTAKRLGLKEGASIPSPLLEYYYKRDDLHDPFVSEEQVIQLSLISQTQWISQIREQAFLINKKLQHFFLEAGIELVDFKMEFGIKNKKLFLADDITPDSCRLWDAKTGWRMDKDRFRRGWDRVEEGYMTIKEQVSGRWEKELK